MSRWSQQNNDEEETFFIDRWLVGVVTLLILYGLLMITSASMLIAQRQFNFPYHFLLHQISFLLLGIGALIFICNLPMVFISRIAPYLLIIGVVLLAMVLIPGLGRVVNGSRRWLHLGFITLQVSEFIKLFFILYLASYLQRFSEQVEARWSGFLKPFVILLLMIALLLREPDFGASVVLTVSFFFMLFVAGARLSLFAVLLIVMIAALVLLAVVSPYRLARITTFTHPWQHQFGSGYQLTQSLIAFGRGGWFGVGLGNSIQKLFYLPEAHTDFLFAVVGEELGLLGEVIMLGLFAVLVVRCFILAQLAKKVHSLFASYVAFGFGTLMTVQMFINVGVNIGLLPTKGLTLPFMSYGGSSLLVNCMMVGVLLRLASELHHMEYQVKQRFR